MAVTQSAWFSLSRKQAASTTDVVLYIPESKDTAQPREQLKICSVILSTFSLILQTQMIIMRLSLRLRSRMAR